MPQATEILALEQTLLNPLTRKDASALERLITDDFIEIGSSGVLYNKRQTIDALLQSEPFRYEIADFCVRELAENIVMAIYRITVFREGMPATVSMRSSIWVSGRIVFHQGTPA